MQALARWFFVLAILTTPIIAEAEDAAAESDPLAFQTVIQSQLDAFGRDDGSAAFAHASPLIKGMFRTPDNFMAMVMNGYPQVYRPRTVDFGATIIYRGQPTQLVYLTGPDGDAVIAYYQMQQQPDGTWQINGVFLEPASNV
jgi:hypothetical protein